MIFTSSRLVRAADFRAPWLIARAAELNEPVKLHRKLWEYAAIAQVYKERHTKYHLSGLAPNVLGFGVGREPLPALFASYGAQVLATDHPDGTDDWTDTNQHARAIIDLPYRGICTDEEFRRVAFVGLDMNNLEHALDPDLVSLDVHVRGGLDFTWSTGSFEHLGSIEQGIEFFCNQMRFLRPGGIAAHTTEYNFGSNTTTLEAHNIVLFRRCDLEEIERRLAAQGDRLLILDLEHASYLDVDRPTWAEPADLFIDTFPYGQTEFHLNIDINGEHFSTSVLLIAIRGGT